MTSLDAWITEHGLGNAAFARRLGGALSRSQVSRIRRGRTGPSLESARTLERATGIPAARLLLGDGA